MTISTTEARITYAGNGSTTTFAIPFDFTGDSEVVVNLVTDSTNNVVLQTNPTEYSISGTDVEMVTAPASGETLIITLGVAESQTTNYIADDEFPAETHEAALDKLTRMTKQLQEQIDYRMIKLPHNLLSSTTITDTDIGASKIFRINAAGTGIELATISAVTGGGDEWGDPVDADCIPSADSTYDLGSATYAFAEIHGDSLYGTLQTAAQTNITSLGTLTTLTVDNITVNGNDISTSSGDLTFTPTGICDFSANTDHLILPSGTTAQRDTSDGAGTFRYNTDDNVVEFYTGSAWQQVQTGSASGDAWGDPVDSSITLDADSTYDLGTNSVRFSNIYGDNVYGTLGTAAQTNITSLGTLTTLTVDNITINGNSISTSSGNIESSEIIDLSGGTSHILMPTGTTAQRVGSTAGEMRYNSTTSKMEYYNGSSWVAIEAGAGSWTFISSTTASNAATLDLDNVFSSTYDVYKVMLVSCVPATDGAEIRARVGTGAGPTYQSGASDYKDNAVTRDHMEASIGLGVGSASGEHMHSEVTVWDPSNTSVFTYVNFDTVLLEPDGDAIQTDDGEVYTATTAVTSLRFYASSGNINGTAYVYGINKS